MRDLSPPWQQWVAMPPCPLQVLPVFHIKPTLATRQAALFFSCSCQRKQPLVYCTINPCTLQHILPGQAHTVIHLPTINSQTTAKMFSLRVALAIMGFVSMSLATNPTVRFTVLSAPELPRPSSNERSLRSISCGTSVIRRSSY